MTPFAALILRDVTLAFRAGGGGAQTALFFALVALVFALAVGPDRMQLAALAAPILWTGALLAALVSLDRIFQADFEDGSLDVLVETSSMLEATVLAKALGHWLTSLLPLVVIAPLLGLLLNLPAPGYGSLLVSLLVGTPALSLIGALAAALTLSLRRASVLVAILATPLFAPALIFGVAAAQGDGRALMLLGAASLVALIVAPLAGAAAIRFNMR